MRATWASVLLLFLGAVLHADERIVIRIPAVPSTRVVFSPSGRLVGASGSPRVGGGYEFYLWDAASAKLRRTFLGGYASRVFSSDEKVVIMATIRKLGANTAEARIEEWDLGAGEQIQSRSLRGEWGIAALARSGKYVVTTKRFPSQVGTVWRTKDWAKVSTVSVEDRNLQTAAIDRNDKFLVTGGTTGNVYVWEVATGQQVSKFKGKPLEGRDLHPAVRFVEFSPDAKLVLASDGNNVVRMWRAADGGLLATVPKATCPECRFTPDGKFFVSAASNVVAFRSVPDGTLAKELVVGTKDTVFIDQIMFSDDGKTAVFANRGGTIHIWDMPKLTP